MVGYLLSTRAVLKEPLPTLSFLLHEKGEGAVLHNLQGYFEANDTVELRIPPVL